MIIKYNFIVISIAVAIATAIPFFLVRPAKEHVEYKVFRTGNGWGYDILVNGKLFIHQQNIPSIGGEEGFSKKSEAEKTAALIINKIERHQLPAVTKFEILQILSGKHP